MTFSASLGCVLAPCVSLTNNHLLTSHTHARALQVLELPTTSIDAEIDDLLTNVPSNISQAAAQGDLTTTSKTFLRYADLLNVATQNDRQGTYAHA